MKKITIFKRFNYLLFIFLVPLLTVSSSLIKELSPFLFKKQMTYYFLSFIIFTVVFFVPWRRILWWFAPLFYFANLLLLIMVEFIGTTILGAKRWVELPILGVTIQPSEFTKIGLFLLLAHLLSRNYLNNRSKKYAIGFQEFAKLSIIIIIPFLLIAKEPDLGTALVLLISGFGILFLAGVKARI